MRTSLQKSQPKRSNILEKIKVEGNVGEGQKVEPHGHSPWHPTSRPSGATSRPNAGALIHGQSPWPSAAGVIVRYETATLQWKGFESRMAIWGKIYERV